ncbi:peptide ABC transpoter substrate-binding protein [Salipiger aestuarii]|uniref:Peptide/nickel transport system substrate-binding protein n=1 Tax=Salipiger aestuarii TaxID=568098 RepID=A0A327YIQ8_9RHOB|nr:ABC transporter substrate-binding protein [Salipiger aestuarii]KAB2542954.1 peptide ABC transpoter substrate-binding protein [Salipiger aestuarii]RAK20883.1 peptide/nickel transport system substrate-binding protein [Salipiger aestuarii]
MLTRLKTGLAAMALSLLATLPVAAQDGRPDLTVAVNNLPDSLESIEEMGNVAVRITYSMFDSLIRRDFLADGSGTASRLVPGLAESWTRIDDRTLELKLREGVLFHDGSEVTSDDVAFSFNPGRGHGYAPLIGAAKRFMLTISHVVPVDKYTIRVVSRKPDVLLEQRLAGYAFWVVNHNAYMTMGKDAFARNPVGTGPYRMDEWVDGEYIRLVAHDDYFGGKPTAKSVTFRQVPEVSARIAGLVSGEYDISVNIPPDQIPTIERYDDLKVERIVLDNTHMLVFYTNGPLEDKRVRQALSLSIDRALLRKALWADQNYTPNGHQLPSYEMWIEDYPEFAYDPGKARVLLQEAGYDGEEIVYKFPLNYYLLSTEAAQAMQQMWQQVGLNVTLQPVENWSQVTDADATVNIRPWSNTHRMPDPLGSFVPQWGAESDVQNNAQSDDRSWKAPAEFNRLQQIITTATDWDARKRAYRGALDIWMDEAPGTMLYNPLETYAMRADIGWKPYGLYYMDLRPYNLTFGAGH